MDIKKITRITNVCVLLLSVAILLLSGLFMMSALNEEQPAAGVDSGKGLGIETLDLKQLEKVLKNLVDKRTGEASPARTRNPFIGNVPAPQPPPPPEPQPEPVPPPPT